MKLGFISSPDQNRLTEDAAFAVKHGFEGLEFVLWGGFKHMAEQRDREIRAVLDDHGLEVSSVGLFGWNTIAADATERKEAMEQIDRTLVLAHNVGANVLLIGPGVLPAGGGRFGRQIIASNLDALEDVLTPLLERIRAAGLKLGLYMLPDFGFIKSIECFQQVCERFPEVGTKLDPGNLDNQGLDYLEFLRVCGDRVFHVHIKDHLVHKGELVCTPPAGMGNLHWGAIMTFLHQLEYKGYLSIEPHGEWVKNPVLRRKFLLISKRYLEQFMA